MAIIISSSKNPISNIKELLYPWERKVYQTILLISTSTRLGV